MHLGLFVGQQSAGPMLHFRRENTAAALLGHTGSTNPCATGIRLRYRFLPLVAVRICARSSQRFCGFFAKFFRDCAFALMISTVQQHSSFSHHCIVGCIPFFDASCEVIRRLNCSIMAEALYRNCAAFGLRAVSTWSTCHSLSLSRIPALFFAGAPITRQEPLAFGTPRVVVGQANHLRLIATFSG